MSLLSKWRNEDAVKRATELQSVIAAIAAPMFIADTNLKITWINDAALQATGYRREEVVGRMICAEFSKTPICNTEHCTFKNCWRTRQPVFGSTEIEIRDGSGAPKRRAAPRI